MGLYLAGPHALDRFGGRGEPGLADALEVARNLVELPDLLRRLAGGPARSGSPIGKSAGGCAARRTRTRPAPISSTWCSGCSTARATAPGWS